MKTILPKSINTIEEAKELLTNLYNNKEHFHPEDDATQLSADIFTKEEGGLLNSLMNNIYSLDGNNDAMDMVFDPCAFLLWLDMPQVIYENDLKPNIYEFSYTAIHEMSINGWLYEQVLSDKFIKKDFNQPLYK